MTNKPTYEELENQIAELKKQIEFLQLKSFTKQEDTGLAANELLFAKEKALESENLYRKMNENSPLGMHFYKFEDSQLIFTGANPAASILLKVDNSQFIGKTIEDAFPPLAQTEVPYRYRIAAEKGISWITEQINYDDKRIVGAFEVRAFQTTPNNMVAIFDDITERKQAEFNLQQKNEEIEAQNEEYLQINEELNQTNQELLHAKQIIEKSEEKLHLMIKNSNDAFVLINANGEQFYLSDAAIRDTGYTIEELKGPIQDVIYPDDLEIVLKAWNDVLIHKDEIIRVQYRHKHKFKEYIWYEAVAQNFLDNHAINAVVVNVRDITLIKEKEIELRNAKDKAEANEKKIKEQNEEIENFFSYTIDLLCIANTEGYFERLNKEWENTLGYSLAELEGKKFLDFVHLDDLNSTLNILSLLDNQIKVINFTNRYRCKDGSYKWIEWKSYTKGDKIYAAARDITGKKIIENELITAKERAEESERNYKTQFNLFQALIRYLPLPFFYKDKFGKYLGCNPAFENFTGEKEKDIIGNTVFDIFKTEIAKTYYEKDLELINNGISQTYENLVSNANKSLRNVIFNKAVYFDENNNPNGIIGTFVDITEQKTIEQELIKAKLRAEESEIFLTAIIENQPGLIWLKDTNGKFQKVNSKFSNSCGLNNPEQLYGKTDFDICPKDLAEKYTADDLNVINSKKSIIVEELIFDNGIKKWFETFKTPIFNEHGNIIGTTGYSIEITDRKNAENELIKAKEKAEESDRLKTAFLQNMSHEIRTPLNAISGFSGFLNDTDLSAEKRKSFVHIIQNSSNQLISIVSDILTISSLETNQEKANINKVCINNIILDLLSIFKQQSQYQNISLYAKQQLSDKQSEIFTDKTKITQILTNLLTNALKFTHEGFIEFGYILKTDIEPAEMEFYVKDSGIGIKPEFHEKIFERFRQADKSINKFYGGTGLGLAISKAFTELLGGKIWVNSEIEKGSTFYFTIPYEPVYKIDKTELLTTQTHNKITILIAEDEEYNFLFLEQLLNKEGIKIIHTKDGKETVEKYKLNHDIILILMDIKMPIMDGYEAAKIIKSINPDLPIIAQTAYALEHEQIKYEGIFDDYITKPINQNDLKQLVMKYIP